MAKKKASRAAKRDAAKKKSFRSKHPRSAPRSSAARRKLPENVALPGMEQVFDSKLEAACRSIAEIRRDRAEGIADEAGHQSNALKQMHAKDRSSYRAYGIELVRVVGEEKLRVRMTKGDGSQATGNAAESAGEDDLTNDVDIERDTDQ